MTRKVLDEMGRYLEVVRLSRECADLRVVLDEVVRQRDALVRAVEKLHEARGFEAMGMRIADLYELCGLSGEEDFRNG